MESHVNSDGVIMRVIQINEWYCQHDSCMIRKVTKYYKLLITVESNYIQVEKLKQVLPSEALFNVNCVYIWVMHAHTVHWVDIWTSSNVEVHMRLHCCEWYCGVDNGGKEFSLYCQLQKSDSCSFLPCNNEGVRAPRVPSTAWGWGEASPQTLKLPPPPKSFQLQFKIMALRKLLPDSKH